MTALVPTGESSRLLVKLEEIKSRLAEAQTLGEVKEIRDQARAMRIYAKERGLSIDNLNLAAEAKLRSDRRLGEMSRALPPAQGSRQDLTSATARPKLAELRDAGITHTTAQQCERIESIPAPIFEQRVADVKAQGKELTTTAMLRVARELEREEHSATVIATAPASDAARGSVLLGDFREVFAAIPDASVDAIITDPPYPEKFLPLYTDLSALAARVLKPGAPCLVMVGQSYLPQVIKCLTAHCIYHWTLAYLTLGGQSPQIWPRHINTFWKPIIWVSNAPLPKDAGWYGDVIRSDENDKRFHHWGQSESGMARLVERFSTPGAFIVDPFTGGGTTGVVAVALGRHFLGAELDAEKAKLAEARIAHAGVA